MNDDKGEYQQLKEDPESFVNQSKPSKRDWPEDFSHENGNYTNRCRHCGHDFIGHKRRVVCKACDKRVSE